jgi:hypothetical protein
VALTAALEPSSPRLEQPALWHVRVLLRNEGDAPVRIATAGLAAPLSFELVDDAGRAVALGPPPVPPSDLEASAAMVEAGETLTLDYHGDELLPDAPAPGRYLLRFVADGLESPWIELDVV